MLNPEEIPLIRSFYAEAFRNLQSRAMPAAIEVSFYRFVGINHTIRLRDGKVFVRVAEMFRGAPAEIQRALAYILVAKLLRKKIPPAASQIYNQYIAGDEIRAQSLEGRRARGRKVVTTAQGAVYDLEEIFARLNREYFADALPKPTLTWSARQTFRRLGHHDAVHETLVISKSLDDANVPAYVVDFVVYHEMLHIKHPTVHRNGRHYNHTPAFRRDEEKFARYDHAEDWIEQNARALKRRVKRSQTVERRRKTV